MTVIYLHRYGARSFCVLITILSLLHIGCLSAQGTAPNPISELTADGTLLVNGAPFLPIGFYAEGIDFIEFPGVPQTLAAAGFNAVYTESTSNGAAAYATFFDDCEALGIKNLIGLPYSFIDPDDFDFYVTAYRDRPSVISWNMLDDANALEVDNLEDQLDALADLDDTRVTSISFYNDTDPFSAMLPLVDVVGMQAYPWEDGSSNDLVFVDALFRSMAVTAEANGRFPFSTPQAFNWGDETFPPAAHLDCQTYLGFITGLKGAMFYTFRDYDLNSTIDVTQPEIFNAASTVAREILGSEWRDVILFGDHRYQNIDFYRYAATWEYEGFLYLMAVNANDQLTYDYSIPLPVAVGGTATNFFPSRPDSLTLNVDRIEGRLAPYQVAIYKMPLASTLPVVWQSFGAERSGKDAVLEWATASEINNAGFYVERSMNRTNWTDRGFVPVAGIAAPYRFTDRDAPSGRTYYRLRQTDLDGAVRFSDIRSIAARETATLEPWPNPTDGLLYFQVPGTVAILVATDLLGRRFELLSQGDRVRVDHLPAGSYLLRLTTEEGEEYSGRFLRR